MSQICELFGSLKRYSYQVAVGRLVPDLMERWYPIPWRSGILCRGISNNESIYYYLVHFIKKAKQKKQIILTTHNPNLAVVCDADQIIHSYVSGGIENPEIAKRVVNILEGTKPAFDNRRLKYTGVTS